jgi:hypothetical protein
MICREGVDAERRRARTVATELEPYEQLELTVVGEFDEVAKGNYSRPHSDDGDAGGSGRRDGGGRRS